MNGFGTKFDSRPKEVFFITLCTVILIYSTGILSAGFTASSNWVSSLWLPSGVCVAMVLIFGISASTPGIFLGTLLFSLHANYDLPSTLICIFGAYVEAVLAGKLLLHVGKVKFKFKDYNEIVAFFFLAVILAPVVAVTLEAIAFQLLSRRSLFENPTEFFAYIVSSSLGILIFTPLILMISDLRKSFAAINSNPFEALFFLSSFLYMIYFAFEHNRIFLIYPFFIWAALRFSYFGVSVSSLIIGLASMLHSVGSLSHLDMFWIQAHVATCSMTGHLLATILTTKQESIINFQQRIMAEEALGVLDQAIQKSPIGFALISRDNRFIRVNEFMARINGQSADFHTGKLIKEVVPANAPYMEDVVNLVFTTGESMLSVPVKVMDKQQIGKEYSGHVSYYPVRLPGSKDIFGVAIMFYDMTEEHKMERMLKEHQRWLNFAQEVGMMGVFECNFRHKSARWTSQLETLYGLEKGEFDGQISTWLKFIHPDDLPSVSSAIKRKSLHPDFSVEFRIIRKDGEVRWMLCRGGSMRDDSGRLTRVSGINVDITEQKQIEQRLKDTESELLNALDIRDEFFAIASHELKTPLTSLKLQIQLHERAIQNNEPGALSREKVEQVLLRNYRQTERLGRLIDDMLDISRMKTGKLTLKRELCEIGSIVRDLVVRNQEHFLNCGSGEPQLEIEGYAFGNWDPIRIEQVLGNIISNAIRYGAGKPIKITMTRLEESVRISIRDQGLGIPATEVERIFERFERGSRSREISGLGLGLFISKEIVEGHDGKIWVESEVGKGSVFHVELQTLKFSANVLQALEQGLA